MTKVVPLPTETVTTMIVCLQRCVTNVSPDTQEAIVAIVGHCSLMVKSRQQQQQQQQPTILRSRGLESGMNPSIFASQLYNHSAVDSISGLNSSLANMSIASAASSAFNLQGKSYNHIIPVEKKSLVHPYLARDCGHSDASVSDP